MGIFMMWRRGGLFLSTRSKMPSVHFFFFVFFCMQCWSKEKGKGLVLADKEKIQCTYISLPPHRLQKVEARYPK